MVDRGEQGGDGAPKATIIVPCYNAEKTLAACLNSALAQSYPNVEVIVVDDGSTDRSAEIAESFGERIRLIRQTNHGLSASRNAAVQAATGRYIVLLDADDMLLPDCVSKRVSILEADPGVGLVAGYYAEIDQEGNRSDRVPELRKVWTGQAFRQAVRRNWGPPVGWTFPVEVFRRVGGFDPLLKSAEDWDFVIRVSLKYSVAYDPTVQCLYRKSAGQMSSNWIVMLDMMQAVHRKNRAYAKNRWQYFVDTAFGRFESGRRILFASIFQNPQNSLLTTVKLCVRHPCLLWIGPLAAFTFVLGKRPSSSRGERPMEPAVDA